MNEYRRIRQHILHLMMISHDQFQPQFPGNFCLFDTGDATIDRHYQLKVLFFELSQSFTVKSIALFDAIRDIVINICPGDGQFDVVYLNSVFHWIAGKDRALREIYRVLKPGGRAAFIGGGRRVG